MNVRKVAENYTMFWYLTLKSLQAFPSFLHLVFWLWDHRAGSNDTKNSFSHVSCRKNDPEFTRRNIICLFLILKRNTSYKNARYLYLKNSWWLSTNMLSIYSASMSCVSMWSKYLRLGHFLTPCLVKAGQAGTRQDANRKGHTRQLLII